MGTSTASPVAEATVAVLLGGRSSEREVSLVSGRALLEALRPAGGGADERGPARALAVEIEADGRWRVGDRSLTPTAALEALADVDVFFLGLHGGEGEGGVLQGLFEAAGRAFTGSGVAASALCLDKINARLVAEAHGLRTARALAVTAAGWTEMRPAVLAELERWGPAWVAKPRHGGSSVGTAVVREAGALAEAIGLALAEGDDVLVEECIPGVEATVAVLGNSTQSLRTFPPVEIRPKEGRFFDYEEKYDEGGAEEFCPPETLDAEACATLQEQGLRAYRALGCSGYARIDFMVPAEGPPVFLEANTLPGFTARSLFPRAAAVEGLDFRSLCLELLRLALAERAARG
ncbi:MAG: D-alanine--D-alanine ligase [Planctomycetota bacterium]